MDMNYGSNDPRLRGTATAGSMRKIEFTVMLRLEAHSMCQGYLRIVGGAEVRWRF